jgi:hypothetical protein
MGSMSFPAEKTWCIYIHNVLMTMSETMSFPAETA